MRLIENSDLEAVLDPSRGHLLLLGGDRRLFCSGHALGNVVDRPDRLFHSVAASTPMRAFDMTNVYCSHNWLNFKRFKETEKVFLFNIRSN